MKKNNKKDEEKKFYIIKENGETYPSVTVYTDDGRPILSEKSFGWNRVNRRYFKVKGDGFKDLVPTSSIYYFKEIA